MKVEVRDNVVFVDGQQKATLERWFRGNMWIDSFDIVDLKGNEIGHVSKAKAHWKINSWTKTSYKTLENALKAFFVKRARYELPNATGADVPGVQ